MATVDYASIADEVATALAEVGGTPAIRRTTTSGPAYDPVVTTTDYACTMMQDMIDFTKVSGTLIEQTDRRVIIASSGLVISPTTADKIVIGGVEHAIKSVQPLQPDPAGTVVYWEVVFSA